VTSDASLFAVHANPDPLAGKPPKTYVHASEENPQRGQAALAKIHKIA
jgi:hypothetical protein